MLTHPQSHFAAQNPVLKINDLRVFFPTRSGLLKMKSGKPIKAVDGVSLELRQGEILGLVGESGCGKTTLGRAIMRLIQPSGGTVEIDGTDFLSLKKNTLRHARSMVQMIFQDPYASLDPRMSLFEILTEPLSAHGRYTTQELVKKTSRYMDLCGLPSKALRKYPHEFSGGQRQRIAIARALILEPKIIIADEPTSALDVSVQAQILNLLKDIQTEFGLSMIFISHNLAVVQYISDRISVMYLGKIVESAPRSELYRSPLHPYTQALVSAVPVPDPAVERKRTRIVLKGDPPSPLNPPSGCAFHPRCSHATSRCLELSPSLMNANGGSWMVSCFEAFPK